MRIALFATCIVDAMYPKVALATVRILERLGHEVVFPPGQVCCSQMHVNSGYVEDALAVVDVLTEVAATHDAEPASVAIAWLLAKGTTAPIASASTPEQLPALLAGTSLELSAQDVAALDEASAPFA